MTRTFKVLVLGISLLAAYGNCATRVPRFAYVANNGDDTVSIFAIHEAGLRAIGYIYTGAGSNPRAVAVTPSQSFLYVAESTLGIAGYSINPINGNLTQM
jgi:6-phosphogluconolactonase